MRCPRSNSKVAALGPTSPAFLPGACPNVKRPASKLFLNILSSASNDLFLSRQLAGQHFNSVITSNGGLTATEKTKIKTKLNQKLGFRLPMSSGLQRAKERLIYLVQSSLLISLISMLMAYLFY